MCGICGTVGINDEKLLSRMCDAISHRGPDDNGIYFGSKAALGHQRLSIIDLSTGHQPIHNEDKSIWVILNGEIYNYQQLRDELLQKGHNFYTKSDTEVIVHLYEDLGNACVDKLRGMFAFAIWDDKQTKLLLARDRLGIKPLYYVHTRGQLLFASEIKSLLKYSAISPQLNPSALDHYLSLRFVPGPETIFLGIQKLQPGYILCYAGNQLKLEQYWDIQFSPDSAKPLAFFVENLYQKLKEAIQLRLISDVPLGAYLSGGLDSSFIVGLMSRLMDKPVETFSIGFAEEKYNELGYAKIIADHFHTQHHTLYTKSNDSDLLEKITWHLDEPLADAAVIPTYLMSQLTKQYVTVVLSGEGADELLAGYPKYKALNLIFRLGSMLPAFGYRGMAGIFANHIDLYRLFSALGSVGEKTTAYMKLVSVFSAEEKERLYSDKFKQSLIQQQTPVEELIRPYFNTRSDALSQLLHLDIKTWLPDDLLLKNDKMTMAHAIEARVPYLDHELVEFAARIPSKYKLRLLQDKYVLRKTMPRLIPRIICRRKKTGFTVPIDTWFKESLHKKAAEMLNKETIRSQGYFNWDYVEHVLTRDLSNQYYRRQFWTLFSFATWQKVFLN